MNEFLINNQENFDMSALIVAPPGDDILDLVKKKLGVKEQPAKAAGTTAPKRN